jgi:hypothetical protein
VGGFIFPKVQQVLTTQAGGSFQSSFETAGGLLLFGAALTFFVRPPKTS